MGLCIGRECTVMTRGWREPSGRDDHAEDQDIGPDQNQLEMFNTASDANAEMLAPPEPDLYGDVRREGRGQRDVEMVLTEVSAGDFPDMDGNDSDDLRRLEDSIRWLMNEGNVRRLPRAATLPPVRGLVPVELHDDDSFLLNPDTLFLPRPSRRRGGIVRGAAK